MASHRDLIVWQKAMELSVGVYGLTRGFPPRRVVWTDIPASSGGRFGGEQPCGRIWTRFATRLSALAAIARGSALEVQTQLDIAARLGFGDLKRMQDAQRLVEDIAKMLWKLMERLNSDRRMIPQV